MLCCPFESSLTEIYKHIEGVHSHLGLAEGMLYATPEVLNFASYLSPHKNMFVTLDQRLFWWEPQMLYTSHPLFFMVFREINSEVILNINRGLLLILIIEMW